MLKITALLFNTFALLIYQLFFADVVTITQSAPSTVKAGTEFIVEVTVKKGAVKGFSKLQLDLPEGFTAVEDKSNGANFNFVNQSVKFVWITLPAEAEFKVSYKVIVAAGISGDKIIKGKLSYIVDNVKGGAELNPPTTVTVSADGAIVVTPPVTPPTPPVEQPPVQPPVTPPTPPPVTPPPSTPGSIVDANGNEIIIDGTRSAPLSAKSPSEFVVEITLKKGKLDGFAKYIETLPAGFSATLVEGKNSAFSFVDQKAKFVWGTLPPDAEFKISYKVTVAANVNADQTIEGIFSFIHPVTQQVQKFIPQPTSVKTSPTEAEQPMAGGGVKPPVQPPVEQPPKQDVVKGGDKPKDTVIPKEMRATGIPPQGKVSYKVQILALRREKSIDVVANLLTVTEPIELEMHQGLRKYVVGYHTVYKEARDHREQIPKAVIAPWVVAYDSGRRTTVQNALMITSQQWFR